MTFKATSKIEFIDLKRQFMAYKEDILARMHPVMEDARFILGSEINELEQTLSAYVNMPYALAVASGTDALLIPLMAAGVKPGDEVITTPFTFIATAEVIQFLGAKPVFVDVDPDTCLIDVTKIERVLNANTKAIIGVSLYGQMADMQAIGDIADKYGLLSIEDGAQSFGASNKFGRSCGVSKVGATSFFPSKPFGCFGDGGMVFFQDEELFKRSRMIRIHGQDKRYIHDILGINGRMDTLQAAILLGKWPHFQDEVEKRQALGDYYRKSLRKIEGVKILDIKPGNTHVYGQMTIRVKLRDELVKYLNSKQIPTAVHYPRPLHLQPVFAHLGYHAGDFPDSECVASEVLSLPFHPFLQTEEVDYIADQIQFFFKGI